MLSNYIIIIIIILYFSVIQYPWFFKTPWKMEIIKNIGNNLSVLFFFLDFERNELSHVTHDTFKNGSAPSSLTFWMSNPWRVSSNFDSGRYLLLYLIISNYCFFNSITNEMRSWRIWFILSMNNYYQYLFIIIGRDSRVWWFGVSIIESLMRVWRAARPDTICSRILKVKL